MERICSNCQYVYKFVPRQDEVERGLTLGCRYPGWEGYVQDEDAKNCHTFKADSACFARFDTKQKKIASVFSRTEK